MTYNHEAKELSSNTAPLSKVLYLLEERTMGDRLKFCFVGLETHHVKRRTQGVNSWLTVPVPR